MLTMRCATRISVVDPRVTPSLAGASWCRIPRIRSARVGGRIVLVGHYAPALVAKAIEPRVPLGILFLAVQLVDVAWAVFVLVGVEHARLVPGLPSNPLDLYDMPYTHSLVATALWAGAAFGLARGRFGTRAALVVAAAVASHWVCDLIVHRPDLPLVVTGPKLGLGLWNFPFLAWVVEIAFLLGAAWWCVRNHAIAHPRAVLALAGGLAVLQTILTIGPLPTSIQGVVGSALVLYFAAAWIAGRVDRSLAT